jgi:hypothetical protein
MGLSVIGYSEYPQFCEVKDGKRVFYHLVDGEKVYQEKNEFPPLQQQAKGFVQSMGAFAASGFKISEDYEQRWETCKTCDYLKDSRCLACGCWMENKAKIAAVKCPLGWW